MKSIFSILITMILISAVLSCSSGDDISVQSIPSLISEEFTSNDTYEVVCRGFPKQGLTGVQKEESGKRAALLNAYYFVQTRFDNTVKPDTDGVVLKYDVQEEFVIVYYRVTKSNLKKREKQK